MLQASAPGTLLTGFWQHADAVVLAVVILLAIASMASWAIIFEKIVRMGRLHGAVRRIETLARTGEPAAAETKELARLVLAARDSEPADDQSLHDLRTRREAAMRVAYLSELRRQEAGLSFLATLASTAPFVGLFGTVWGIMQSFSSIAAAKDTSLAVVAPGIAEALFATAMGLGAAIPAVIGYNLVRSALVRSSHRLAAASVLLAKAPLAASAAAR